MQCLLRDQLCSALRTRLLVIYLGVAMSMFGCANGTRSYTNEIPDPNVCGTPKSTLTFGTWDSYDCPANALCVPAKKKNCVNQTSDIWCHNFCSCEFSEDMYVMNEDRKCVASTSTKMYALYQALLSVASLLIATPLGWTLYVSFKTRAQKFDFVLLSGLLSFVSLALQCLHRAIRVPILVYAGTTHISTQELVDWRTTGQVLLSISYCSMLAMLFVVGVGFHSFLRKSNNLRGVDVNKLKNEIGRVVVGSLATLVVGDIILVGASQFAIAFCFSATFIMIAFLLYRRVLGNVLGLAQDRNSNISAGSRASFRGFNPATDQIFISIRILSLQALFLLPFDCAVCIVYILMWIVGRDHRSAEMLGPGKVAASCIHFVLFTAMCFCVYTFVRSMVKIRKDNTLMTSMRAIESENRKTVNFSSASLHQEMANSNILNASAFNMFIRSSRELGAVPEQQKSPNVVLVAGLSELEMEELVNRAAPKVLFGN